MVLLGDGAPCRAELEMWLQGHPEFAVDPRFLAYMEERRKQKWQRCKINNKAELNCLGMEPVQTANSRNGEKSHYAETAFNRVLPGSIAPRPDLSKMMALMQGGSTGSLSLQNTFQHSSSNLQSVGHSSAISASLPFVPFMMGGAAASPPCRLQHRASSSPPPSPSRLENHCLPFFTSYYHLWYCLAVINTATWDDDEEEDEDDDLSQGYDSSERDFSLIDDPMMPANSDSSDDADD